MITPTAIEPSSFGGLNLGDYRHRAVQGERPLLPDSTAGAPASPDSGRDRKFAKPEQPQQPAPPRRESGSMFAAAVIAGALSPTPQTMEEVFMRIGISTIPEDSQARLKDLLA